LEFSADFHEVSISNFIKIRSLRAALIQSDRQTDGQTEEQADRTTNSSMDGHDASNRRLLLL